MHYKPGMSAIVPCYNEGKRLLVVVEALKQAKNINEIIVADDSSDEETKKIISNLGEHVTVIHNDKNVGKTKTLEIGVRAAHYTDVFFLDADLIGLTPKLIDGMVNAYRIHKPTILIGDRVSPSMWFRAMGLFGMEIAFTGERMLSQRFIHEHPEVFDCKGYEFEALLNRLTFGRFTVYKYPLLGVSQTYKSWKQHSPAGLFDDAMVMKHLSDIVGVKNFLYQCWFAKYGMRTVTATYTSPLYMKKWSTLDRS